MKFFICGCNGMAGHTISLYLREQGHEVYGFDLQESKLIKSFAGNAFDTETIARVIKDGKYDTVINCIGVLNQFAENNHALAAFLESPRDGGAWWAAVYGVARSRTRLK